jgi:hypothetical protein
MIHVIFLESEAPLFPVLLKIYNHTTVVTLFYSYDNLHLIIFIFVYLCFIPLALGGGALRAAKHAAHK